MSASATSKLPSVLVRRRPELGGLRGLRLALGADSGNDRGLYLWPEGHLGDTSPALLCAGEARTWYGVVRMVAWARAVDLGGPRWR
jgi:hypothetical protein